MYLCPRERLSLPLVSGGLGHGASAYSPDEYLIIEGNDRVARQVRAERSCVDILYACAERPEQGTDLPIRAEDAAQSSESLTERRLSL